MMEPNQTVAKASPDLSPRQIAGLKALVLDDNLFDRRRLRRLTEDAGMGIRLAEAATLDSLDDVLDAGAFDVIFLDYNLPAGNGIEALNKVRAHPLNAQCPVIMITGEDNSGVAVKSLKMGCADYLTKDALTPESLRATIVSAIEGGEDSDIRVQMLEAEIDRITAAIMTRYSEALQPKLARMIRDLRTLRTGLGKTTPNVPDSLERIERQCIQMWATLLDQNTVTSHQGTQFRN